jgi:hypothetical protein
MKMTSTLIIIHLLFFQSVSAQVLNRCSTNDLINSRAESNPSYLSKIIDTQNEIAQYATMQSLRASDEVLRIPVVVHIIHNNETQNISDAQVQSQIDRLNGDYRRLNSDANLTRDEFLPVAADTKIEFFLTQWDPEGNPTNGITRTQTSQASFWLSLTDMKSSSTSGKDAWDVNHFLNIWVCNMAIPFINLPLVLGFATPPEGAPNWPAGSVIETPAEDGVVVHYEVFGPNPSLTGTLAAVNQGRTATHEVGHYLGLRHIWGDGDCTQDDGLNDTPSASEANQQTCDYSTNSCIDVTNELPDMLENYMDYSDENCMNAFTQQQTNAMRFVIENFRFNLLLNTDEINSKNTDFSVSVYPNPALDHIQLLSNSGSAKINEVEIIDMSGRMISHFSDYNMVKIDVSNLSSGIYFLHIHTTKGAIVNKFIKQ